ncbi:MAG TPA: multidrug ABC transporter ATP-binding protein, partial [Bradyrhizobium sp.]|nr:multidrug ABC transporter ATP-binding protein [Bradyrhizobium sp.]
MIRFFEKLIHPTATPANPEPPAKLIPFYWHYARQAKGLFIFLFVIELFVALTDSAVPWCIGKVVTLLTKVEPDNFVAETWPWLVAMALLLLVVRPGVTFTRYLVTNQALAGPFSNLIRWQSHWHVVR